MPNTFDHIELTTDNLKQAEKFYRSVFSWKLKPVPGMPYTMIDVGTGRGGGMQQRPMPEAPTGWMPYVTVDDVMQTVAKASKAGATVVVPYHDLGEMGALGIFKDPGGSLIGVWQPKTQPKAAAKKAVAKKAVAKKAPAKKAPAKKAPAKKR